MKKKNLLGMGDRCDYRDYRDFSAFCFLLSAFCLLLSASSLHAQVDTRGTDFWLTFGKNGDASSAGVDLQIRIVSGGEASTGVMYFTKSGTSVPFSIVADQVYTYPLSNTEKQAVYNDITGKSNYSVHITTSTPVSVYALNQQYRTTDATNVLPSKILGTDYYDFSFRTMDISDAYSVIATENNTQIRHNNSVVATLNRGEVYYHTASTDMTGAHITATKPVALFAMCQGTNIPERNQGNVDCLFQQLVPVHTWGKHFFVPVAKTYSGKDVVRVVASQNGTTVKQKGGTVRTGTLALNAGQYVEIETAAGNGCYITADKPVGACIYFVGGGENYSDPAQAWLPSMEQTLNSALMAPFIPKGNTQINKHYVIVITDTLTKSNTRVKIGSSSVQPLSGGGWFTNPTAGMAFYSMLLTDSTATYLFTNPAGLILMAYGTGYHESYYYMAAASMRNLKTAFYVNDIHYQDVASEIICTQPVKFRASITGNMSTEPGHLKWYIDDMEEVAARDSLRWSKALANGTYRIKMIVLAENGVTIDTVESVVTVKLSEFDPLKDVFLCVGDISPVISFSGADLDVNNTVWEVTSGLGMAIGLNTESGTGFIPSFTSVSSDNSPATTVKITVTPKFFTECSGAPVTFTITVYTQFSGIDLGKDTSICWIDSLRLNATHPLVTHYQWQDHSTGSTYTVYQDNRGEYWVIVDSKCGSTSDTINVSYLEEMTLNLGSDTTFCENQDIVLKLNAGNPHASYLWQDGHTDSVYVINNPGIYSVTVSNACGSLIDEIEINTINCELEFTLPNIFTPNGDGINDSFGPELMPVENVKEFQMYIYDRWGRLVFSTEDVQKTWDGNNKQGRPYADGIYYCVIYYMGIQDRETHTVHASITLLR